MGVFKFSLCPKSLNESFRACLQGGWVPCGGSPHLSCNSDQINFCAILLAILGHMVRNRRAGNRQYTLSVSLFAVRFVSGRKA